VFQQYIAHNSLLPFYLTWELNPQGSNYNLCFSYHIKKDQVNSLIHALQQLVAEKAYLRQTFYYENEQLVTRLHEQLPPEIEFYIVDQLHFSEIANKIAKQPHDILLKSSVRLSLIELSDSDQCVALFNIHHIIMDGITLDNFIIDLNKLLKNQPIMKESEEDYVLQINQVAPLHKEKNNVLIDEYIEDIYQLSPMTNYYEASNGKIDHYTNVLPNKIFQSLQTFSKNSSISAFNLLLIAQSIFLSKLFNEPKTLLHYPIDIRRGKSINGCFLNLVAYPLKLEDNDTFLSLITKLKSNFLFFKQLAKTYISNQNDTSFIPSFAVSNFAKPLDLVIDYPIPAKTYPQLANAPLCIKYQERAGRVHFTCDIINKLLPGTLADTLIERFFYLIERLLDNPARPLKEISILLENEAIHLLCKNKTITPYPKNKTIQRIFEEQVDSSPNKIAIIYASYSYTYTDINKKANQLAHYLRNNFHLNSESIIALCFDRSPAFIISLLAVLKTGSAYVALNPDFHHKRAAYILNDTKAKLCLTTAEFFDKCSSLVEKLQQMDVIAIDNDIYKHQFEYQSQANIICDTHSNNLAHVIYTSGTTGSPKGVMIEHQNVTSLVKDITYISIDKSDTFALFSDLTFDASTFEIWGALLNGASLFIPEKRWELLSDTTKLYQTLVTNQVSILWLTKTLFDQLFLLNETLFQGLRYLLVGGEALNKPLMLKLVSSSYRPKHIINGYGPTENTTFSCTFAIQAENLHDSPTVPIGIPLSNRSAYVLDLNLNLLPVGAVGELYVGGAGLARGYLNKDELTSQKFIINPFQTPLEKQQHSNSKLYKTGDLARMLPDNNIEYLGRNDFQVKIRGYRIELSEIESVLINHPKIKQAVVIENTFSDLQENIGSYLIAYYIAPAPIKELELRDFLLSSLPEYMLPKKFMHLKKFPQLSSGKLNRQLLPPPTFSDVENKLEPRNKEEHIVLNAFIDILGFKQICITDDFFYSGGNSIKAIALAAKLQAKFKISVADIFNKRTPEKIARNIEYATNDIFYQLKKIKLHFQQRDTEDKTSQEGDEKLANYFKSLPNEKIKFSIKPIKNILLTGATGYLGANLLHQFLNNTEYKLILLVRAPTLKQAFERVNKNYQFYFDNSLANYQNQIKVYVADLEKINLGLTQSIYDSLVDQVDSIVHAAALTKHYGEYDKFYSANVLATINLLELSKQTKLKDFHHVSTISVLDNSCDNQESLTEDDVITKLDGQSNIYIKTKHEAEKQVLKFMSQGINANIYRIGNLAFIFDNCRTQRNIDDNAFFSRMKCFVKLKAVAKELSMEEISPVDYTANAIIKIFDKQELTAQIFHVYNPILCDISSYFGQLNSVKILSINNFIDLLACYLKKPTEQADLIMRYMLHQGWLDGEHRNQVVHHILQERTKLVLRQLDFQWPIISKEIFWNVMEQLFQTI
jgi:amino acid adenylation domain-containing protein/thioester reductase-like protein